jgi:tRNA (cmo5U34)-methyltransferase
MPKKLTPKTWSFSGKICQNFTEHIKNSVPFYFEGHALITELANFFLRDGSTCYELGCSNGNLIFTLSQNLPVKKINFIGIDQSSDMIKEAKKKCTAAKNIQLICEEISQTKFMKSDLIIAYYTLQFLPLAERQKSLKKIYNALNPGGALILFEKTFSANAKLQDIFNTAYYDFKLKQGFNHQEIIEKTRSLKGILNPLTSAQNLSSLKKSGFSNIEIIMKYLSFEGYLAIKQ